jgi:hypothetical protein
VILLSCADCYVVKLWHTAAQVIAVWGDQGQTINASNTMAHILHHNPDYLVNTADWTCAWLLRLSCCNTISILIHLRCREVVAFVHLSRALLRMHHCILSAAVEPAKACAIEPLAFNALHLWECNCHVALAPRPVPVHAHRDLGTDTNSATLPQIPACRQQ